MIAVAVFLLGLLCGPTISAQNIIINELLASNVANYPEMHDFDDYSDWIELYNTDNVPYSLENMFLTDDLSDPLKWKITDGAVIDTEGYLLIWADDYNVGPGQVYTRPYWPWDSFTTQHYHANFKLSKSGEQLALFLADQTASDTLIYQGSLWKYLSDGTDQGSDWTESDFDDSNWASGYGEFGYGDGDEETVIEYGPDPDEKYITTYFRHTFNIDNLGDIQTLIFSLKRDDGAVIYLNGEEVVRANMTTGSIAYDTYASSSVSGPEEDTFFDWFISGSSLIVGQNTVAVEIHQVDGSSSDISFDLELIGDSYSNMVLIDSVSFNEQFTDASYGRQEEENSWSFFGEPTPGHSNSTEPTNNTELSGPVSPSLTAGFYSGTQTTELLGESDEGLIYYTLDGSRPSSQTNLYTTPISIENTTVLKARAYNPNKLPGKIMVSTYFIDEQNYLPTISLVAEPETLWDQDIGIYLNEYKQREIPVSVEYFTLDSEHGFTANAGARLGGLNIWTKPQKPFTIYTRNRFGQDYINYQLFDSKQIANFSRIVFRNGGDDWEETLIRDAMTESLVAGMMDCGYMAYSPSALFLNGNYWGIHNIREKFDTQYFFENFGADPNNIDHLEYTLTPSGTQLLVVEGDVEHYNTMINFIINYDINDPIVYGQIKQWMNIDSFIDHIIMTLYCANTSWGHNREWWRSREGDGKWNWMIVDLDRGFNILNSNRNLLDDLMEDYELFQYLLNSQLFKDRFIQRSAAHLSNTFYPEKINAIVDSLSSKISAEMPRHISRWSDQGGVSSLSAWQDELNQIKQFSSNRNNTVRDQFISELNLEGTIQVSTMMEPPETGKIFINNVPVVHPDGIGAYFKNKSIRISVLPMPGYQFVGWEDASDSIYIDYNCSSDSLFTAVFELSDEIILPFIISENTSLDSSQTYVAITDVLVPSLVTLTINEGTHLKMMQNINLIIEGKLIINGTDQNPVEIFSHSTNGDSRWGSICFNNSADTSLIKYTKINGASVGIDPTLHHGAISSINSNIIIDNTEINDVEFPVYVEGGSIIVRDCSILCDYICDFINVKSGNALIENSMFFGSNKQDTDAIDLDNVTNGIIRNNRIYDFTGYNSDGIDIGENSQNILIESNLIYHAGDKGVSVGQGSTVTLRKNLIVGCNSGVAVKDNASVYVINNTFFQNDTSVLCYEKNEGEGGGSAEIINTILSNSSSLSLYADETSSIDTRYSLSDSEIIEGIGNIFSDPLFVDQTTYNLELDSGSVCIDAGDPNISTDEDGTSADIGAYYFYSVDDYPFEIPGQLIGQLVINEILVINNLTNIDAAGEFDDWAEIYNPTDQSINLSGLFLTDDINNLTKWQFPNTPVMINPGGFLLIWCDDDSSQGLLHTNFKLSSTGEDLIFVKEDGETIIDNITFGPQTADQSYGRIPDGSTEWRFLEPTPGSANTALSTIPNSLIPRAYHLYQNYPNPFNPQTTFHYDLPKDGFVSLTIYNMMGREIKRIINGKHTAGHKFIRWNAQDESSGVYIIRMEGEGFTDNKKVLLIK